MSMEQVVRAYVQGRMDRREFIRALGALGVTAGAALSYVHVLRAPGVARGAVAGSPASAALASPLALTSEEFRVLQALAARIFPTTDTPGATEAGATEYVDLALAGPYASFLPRYRRGLDELDRYAASTLGAAFAALSEAQQDAMLEDLEAGRVTAVEGGPEFFLLVQRHVIEGVFCEPQYGGNRDLVGWRLVGFPGQRYGYSDPYINRVVDAPPIAVDGPPPISTRV